MMVATPVNRASPTALSLEEFIAHPPDGMEWVDGNSITKTGMTIKHSVVQGRLTRHWGDFILETNQGGEVCPEAPCRTLKQARRPDVAYITPELLAQFGDITVLPQSFPLIAEVASPDDKAEDLFAKAQEYLASGCEEVWLLFPESCLVMVNAQEGWQIFQMGEVASTQVMLPGFQISVEVLFK